MIHYYLFRASKQDPRIYAYLEFNSAKREEQLRWKAFKKSAILFMEPDMRSTYSLPAQSACVLSWSASRWCWADVLVFLDLPEDSIIRLRCFLWAIKIKKISFNWIFHTLHIFICSKIQHYQLSILINKTNLSTTSDVSKGLSK